MVKHSLRILAIFFTHMVSNNLIYHKKCQFYMCIRIYVDMYAKQKHPRCKESVRPIRSSM